MANGITDTEFRGDWEALYVRRYNKHIDELKWLYMELYSSESMLSELCSQMHNYFAERDENLKNIDVARENNPDWYRKNTMIGMMLYIDNFAENIKGAEQNIEHLQKCNVNYVHLMPFYETSEGKEDDGYAVTDLTSIDENLGTMEDLENFAKLCHEKDINVSIDFIMNHTSDEHEWASRAKHGDGEYMNRYFLFENDSVPKQYEEKMTKLCAKEAQNDMQNFTWVEDAGNYAMTTFYPYEWDLNYKNPRVFNEMMYNFMYLANRGIDIMQLDRVEFIWKEPNTECRNLLQVHTIIRMMRIISEIVCPGVLLLGDIFVQPESVLSYFGTSDKPECHMLYDKTSMAITWHTVATRNVKLLRKHLDFVNSLPKQDVFINCLRNGDEIQWELDYEFLKREGFDEEPHKKYLNEFFVGKTGYSRSRGELYSDGLTDEEGFCGTTASMCGLEKAMYENNVTDIEKSIKLHIMLHAFLCMQSGIPVLYSGDEVGQLNDYSYKYDLDRAKDTRYLHRESLDWQKVVRVVDEYSIEGRILRELNKIENVRKSESTFEQIANARILDTWNDSVLCIVREFNREKTIGIFNFSEYDKTAWINEADGMYEDLITGQIMEAKGVDVQGYGFYYLKRL